jgi:hypothetical protein
MAQYTPIAAPVMPSVACNELGTLNQPVTGGSWPALRRLPFAEGSGRLIAIPLSPASAAN